MPSDHINQARVHLPDVNKPRSRRPTNFHQSAVPASECLANKVLRNQSTDKCTHRPRDGDTGMFTTRRHSVEDDRTALFSQRIDMVMLGTQLDVLTG